MAKPVQSVKLPTMYVVGFYFYSTTTAAQRQLHNCSVTLILKQRPEWQRGLLNGVGGHVEPGESPEQAMAREFEEEAGVVCARWEKFLVLKGTNGDGEDYMIHFFRAFHEGNSAAYFAIKAQTDEQIVRFPIEEVLHWRPVVPNLKWIIPLAFQPGLIVAEQVD